MNIANTMPADPLDPTMDQKEPLVAPPEKDAPEQTEEGKQATKDAIQAQTDYVNKPIVDLGREGTVELPSHIGAITHAAYPEKPLVQVQNETLTNATPTGYAPVDPAFNLDEKQAETIKPENHEAYGIAQNRLHSDDQPEEG